MPPNADPTQEAYYLGAQCPSPTWCAALGGYTDLSGHSEAFASVLSDGVWTSTELPLVNAAADPAVFVNKNELACPQVGTCYAIGSYALATATTGSFIDTLSGGSWTAAQPPAPAGAPVGSAPDFSGVSCSSATSCVAVGVYSDTASTSAGVLVSLSGSTWTAARAPMPATDLTSPYADLYGVSCPAAGTCVAVGTYTAADTFFHSYVETEAGGTWTAAVVAPPADVATSGSPQPYDELSGVSCPTTQWCEAVGDYVPNSTYTDAPMTATFSNGTWTTGRAPGMVSGQTDGYLNWVSCSWPGSCVATGSVSTDNDVNRETLVDTMSGGTWTGNDATLPSGGQPALFNEVYVPSCVAGFCVVGGSYRTSTSSFGFLATYSNLSGYQEVASDGGLFTFGTPFYGSMGGKHLNAPIVGMAVQPDNGGYYEVASDGGIFNFGASFYGSMGGQHLNAPIVGIAFDSRTGGYYEVASDGGIFAFGAPFYGSMGGQHLNSPIVGMAFDGATGGYYEVAADGGLFAFGAPFQGSMGGQHLNKPVVGMAVDPATGGYYEVASDGGLFAFGAPFQGSMGGTPLNQPIVGLAVDTATGGYYEAAADGGLFAFGAPFQGSMGGQHLNKPVVGMAFG